MLTILLSILKIIGIILLIILAIFLLLLLTVLLSAIRYYLEAEKYDDIKAKGEIRLFWGILKAEFVYAEGVLKSSARVFNKILYTSEEEMYNEDEDEDFDIPEPVVVAKPVEKPPDPKPKNEDKPKPTQSAVKPQQKRATEKIEEKPKPQEKQINTENTEPKIRRIKISDIQKNENAKNAQEPEKETKKEAKKEPEKIDYDYFKNMSWKEKKKIVGHVLRLFKRVLKHILPKECSIKINVGAGDPALTGQILGALGILSGATGIYTEAKGNFAEKELTGEIELKGRIRIGSLLMAVIKFGLSKEIFKIIRIYMKGNR